MKSLLLAVLALAWSVGVAQADVYRPAYLELRQTAADSYDLLWKVPALGEDRRLALRLELPPGIERGPLRRVYVGSAFLDSYGVRFADGLAGTSIAVGGLDRTGSEVLVRVERLDGGVQVARLTPDAPSFVVSAGQGTLEVARTYLRFGVQHIWQGLDHLLFVACLVLIAGSWRRILVTVTGFTIAHSITLTLAALQLVRVPVPPVEAMIALSIVFLAREIALDRRDTLTWRYPIAVSVSFGLLHGFGFASALAELGLPQTEIAAALLSFNLGVEIGQILFVAVVIVLVRGFRRLMRGFALDHARGLRPAQLAAIYAIGGLSAFWLMQRIDGFWI